MGKVLASAVANARNNDELDPDELFVSACFADEGTTLKRWRPRARGRATRIRKRTCHITVIVSRLPEDKLERRRARQATETSGLRSRRVAASRRGDGDVPDGETSGSPADSAEVEPGDLDATSTDVVDDQDDVVDEQSTEDVDAGERATGDDDEFEEPAWLDEADADAGVDAEESVEVEPEEAAPAPKPRRARRSTKKAAAQADESDSGGSAEEEKD